MTIEYAGLAALYPVLAVLCIIGVVRFYPARRNQSNGNRSLVTGLVVMMATLGLENIYYGIARFYPPFYSVFGANVWIVGATKIAYIAAMTTVLRAYWEITDTKPGRFVPLITAVAMWLVLTLFVMLS